MDSRPKFFYVTYPIPIEMADEFPMPQAKKTEKEEPFLPDETDFMPSWFGNAKFPEDEY